jgi:hypothetical protein
MTAQEEKLLRQAEHRGQEQQERGDERNPRPFIASDNSKLVRRLGAFPFCQHRLSCIIQNMDQKWLADIVQGLNGRREQRKTNQEAFEQSARAFEESAPAIWKQLSESVRAYVEAINAALTNDDGIVFLKDETLRTLLVRTATFPNIEVQCTLNLIAGAVDVITIKHLEVFSSTQQALQRLEVKLLPNGKLYLIPVPGGSYPAPGGSAWGGSLSEENGVDGLAKQLLWPVVYNTI